MPLMKQINDLSRNRRKNVKEVLKWFEQEADSKSSFNVWKVPSNQYMKIGKIYKFYYNPIDQNKPPYFDVYPLVLALGKQKNKNSNTELGLNLNYLPFKIRAYIINTIYKNYKYDIDKEIKSNRNDAKKQSYLDLDYDTINDLFDKYNLTFAIRQYKKERRYKTYCISYDNLVRVPFLESPKMIKKTVGEIHSLYNKSLKK